MPALEATTPRDVIDLTQTSPPVPRSRHLIEDPNLTVAVTSAQPDRLRQTLLTICKLSSEANGIARRLLLVTESSRTRKNYQSEGDDEEEGEDEEQESVNEGSSSVQVRIDTRLERKLRGVSEIRLSGGNSVLITKHVRSRYATCVNCKEEFDVAENGRRDCIWHSGELRVCLIRMCGD